MMSLRGKVGEGEDVDERVWALIAHSWADYWFRGLIRQTSGISFKNKKGENIKICLFCDSWDAPDMDTII